jgi:hypothetical protein
MLQADVDGQNLLTDGPILKLGWKLSIELDARSPTTAIKRPQQGIIAVQHPSKIVAMSATLLAEKVSCASVAGAV